VLLFSPDDVAIQEYFLSGTYPTKRQVRQVYETIEHFNNATGKLAEESPPNVANIALGSSVGQQRTRTVLSLLKDEGFITEEEGGLFHLVEPPREKEELMERAKQYEARRIADRQRLDALLTYVKAPGCRNQVILEYLGEPQPPKCGRCDNCLRSREAALAASTQATRFGATITRQLDEEGVEQAKPRREIKARVVRIDQQQPVVAAAGAEGSAPVAVPTEPLRPAPPSTVLRRSAKPAEPAKPSSNGHAAPAATASAPAPTPVTAAGSAPVAAAAGAAVVRKKPVPAPEPEELDDEEDEDLEDEDEEEELDENGNPIEVDDEEFDDEDDEDFDDEDDDDLDDDEDDEDFEDDEDDDYEVIDKTAAELAEEGIEGPGEITVLARKRVPKQPKQRPQRAVDTSPSASAAEARRRRRRRRRKRRAMLPPKSAFVTPVLSTAAPIAEAQPRRPGGGGGGPVIEYVRGPMRIAAAPVASANPNDAGVARRRGKKRRWERGPGGNNGNFRNEGPRRFDQRPFDPNRPGGGGGGPQQGAQAGNGDVGPGGERRRRRRRRRRRGNGAPMQGGPMQLGGGAPGDALPPDNGEPVSFFQPSGPQQGPMLGPDGQPMRKRRRRRRRGRGGRNREWRMQNGGEGGGGGTPPSEGGGGDGGGGAITDGGAG
jgi:hypothetical protein